MGSLGLPPKQPASYLSLGPYLQISPGCLLLVAWLHYADTQGIIPLALLSCALHEGGHIVAISLVGGRVEQVTLTVVGAEITLPTTLSYPQEFFCALAGPGVNLLLAWGFAPLSPLFAGLNLALAGLNLLPLRALDGGRALGCLLGWTLPLGWHHAIATGIDLVFAGGLFVVGLVMALLGGSVTLLILSSWLLTGVVKHLE